MATECLICERVEMARTGTNPYLVAELETGYAVIGDGQFFKGYSLFLCKRHIGELHELDEPFRQKFLAEMSMVAEAVHRAFKPRKLNYELLGNSDPHLHWHLFPRHADDPNPRMPVWLVSEAFTGAHRPTLEELDALKTKLRQELAVLVSAGAGVYS